MKFDLLLKGAEVIDGSGRAPFRSDVGISGDRIRAVDDLTSADADVVLDVASMYVCPGFIDVHAHTDLAPFLAEEHVDVKAAGIRQGVTTEVCGNCGASPFPVRADAGDDPFLGAFGRGGFVSLLDWRKSVSEQPLFANMAPLLGHGTLRASVVGPQDRTPTADELVEMRRGVSAAMDEGAFGLSSGLIYAPGMFGATEELVALATELSRFDRPYTTHMRDEGDAVAEAVTEAIRIGREAGVAVQISHHKVAGRRNWGRSAETLAAIVEARGAGLDLTIDCYPYTAGSTLLGAVLPPWALDGGPKLWLERLRDTTALERMERDIATGLARWQNIAGLAGWDNVIVTGVPPNAGRSIAQIASNEGVGAMETVARLLCDNPATVIIVHMMDDAEVTTIGDQPFAIVGSDGIPLPGQQHPRLAGTFARMLGRHAGDRDALADVVRRMTSLAAKRFAVPDRGVVMPGKLADLVVFDPRTVGDRATYEEPLLPPAGIPHVLMAGKLAVRDGELTGVHGGRVLEPAR